MDAQLKKKLLAVSCVICDLDGVLTDGLIHLDESGIESKTFHVHDGMGLKLLMNAGFDIAVITTSKNAIVDKRMKQLGVKHCYSGQLNKLEAYHHLKESLNINDSQCLYIGDDLPDLSLLALAGVAVAVADANNDVKKASYLITEKCGGRGAVREVCDLLLDVHEKKTEALLSYLNA